MKAASTIKALTVASGLAVFGLVYSMVADLKAANAAGSAASGITSDLDEQQLVGVLQSSASAQEKDAACARLKWIGSARCVATLASLLSDEQLSHSARYALESMPWPEAGKALREALETTSRLTKVGIINSLGLRRDAQAAPALEYLLGDNDGAVAVAAARALGQIGGAQALSSLQTALAAHASPSADPLRGALADAILRCGYELLESANRPAALAAFQQLYGTQHEDSVRVAAFRGMVLASGKEGLTLMRNALMNSNGSCELASLQLVHEVDFPGATKAFVDLLPKVRPATQRGLIGALALRGDVSAGRAVAALEQSDVPEVRLAALKAMGILGDAGNVPLLTKAAASGGGSERKAAFQSLTELRRGDVVSALLAQLSSSQPEEQEEAARVLGERGEVAAVSKLLAVARRGGDSARKAAFDALAVLVDAPQLSSLVDLVVQAKSEGARAQAAAALNQACHHLQTKNGHLDALALVNGLKESPVEARLALLSVCSGLIDPGLRAALRAATTDADARIRAAGIRALCDTTDAELLPDVGAIACDAPEEAFRTLAVRACVRLTTQEETVKLSNVQRVAVFKPILQTQLQPEQKRLVLSALAEIPDPAALALVDPFLKDDSVQAEADEAAIKIAGALLPAQSQVAAECLRKVLAGASSEAMRKRAGAALEQLELAASFLTAWQVAGPFRQEGKGCTDLFDISFPPEQSGTPDVKWQSLSAGTDPRRPWLMDLLKALGGEQCVAYAQTWVHSDQQEAVLLEVGSDDGVKVWLNGELIHANNAVRGLQPGSDRINAVLKAGWNRLLLKVTQYNQGWEFCARFRKPDGSPAEGLRDSVQPVP
ncbi:exported hypothetical protein [Verrucomicrobia bacterium]|nr:exported hypothetical protein [Verrucomicrobiota bacterium]